MPNHSSIAAMKMLSIAGLGLLSWGSMFLGIAGAKPLTGGTYLGPGNHKIWIVSVGDRTCYQSVSRGTMVSSVTPDPTHRGIYRLDGIPNFALYQPSPNTLLYGEANQLTKAKAIALLPQTNDALLKKCLNSTGIFYKRSAENLGG